MNKYIYIVSVVLLFSNCKKVIKCNDTYTITGNISNGTTKKWWIGLPITFYSYDNKKDKVLETLGSTKTDSLGNFSFSYKCSKEYADQINLSSGVGEFYGIPFNQSTHQIIYFSTASTIKVKYQTDIPLDGDTLFVCQVQGTNPIVKLDTLINLPLNYSTLDKYSNSRLRIFWGRGNKEFLYDENKKDIIRFKKEMDFYSKGDPYIDSVVINY